LLKLTMPSPGLRPVTAAGLARLHVLPRTPRDTPGTARLTDFAICLPFC
jgi:hypothetical protein